MILRRIRSPSTITESPNSDRLCYAADALRLLPDTFSPSAIGLNKLRPQFQRRAESVRRNTETDAEIARHLQGFARHDANACLCDKCFGKIRTIDRLVLEERQSDDARL